MNRLGLAAIALGVLALSACGSAPISSTGKTPTTQATTQVSTPPPVAPTAPTLGQLEQQWANGPTLSDLYALEAAMNSVQGQIPSILAGDFSGVEAACQQVSSSAAAALADPANPDPVAQQHLASAFADFAAAGSLCVQGSQALDASMINQATADMNQGGAEIQAATEQLKADCPNGAQACA